LVGMYISNTFFNERAIWLIILLTIVGAVAGVLFFGK
jgi:hypothetical protein